MTKVNQAGAASMLRPSLAGRDGVEERLAPEFAAAPSLALPRKREREKKRASENA